MLQLFSRHRLLQIDFLIGCFAVVIAVIVVQAAPAQKRVSLVVTGGTVVTMDEARRVLEPGAVAIEGNRIVAVGTPADIARDYSAPDVIQAEGTIVTPGLINTHGHAAMVLFRGLADDMALMDWLNQYIFPAEAKMVSPEFVRVGTTLAALEMIQSGTTLYADMYYFEEEAARATRTAGLRGVLGQTVIGFPVADAKTPAAALERAARFIDEFKNDPLVIPAVAPHSMYTVDADTLRACRALATAKGVPLLTHLSETRDEQKTSQERHGLTPTAYLESLGFWGPSTLAAHGVWLSDEDLAILSRRKVGLSHNPESNMKLASGTARVTKWLDAGIAAGLGTDGAASNNDLDMFDAMRITALLHKLIDDNPQSMPAARVLEMATIGGARAMGMGDRLGSLEPGKLADLILINARTARLTPLYNPVSHLVYVTRGDDVLTSIIDGKVVMRDRRVLTLDAARVMADANAMGGRVKAAVGGKK
jgi:5-methylthioadenosine/S-adenosylhomocysteine deaminase